MNLRHLAIAVSATTLAAACHAGEHATYEVALVGPGLFARGLNDHGVAIGERSVSGNIRAWVGDASGMSQLLPLPAGYLSSTVGGINNHGVIVGAVGQSFSAERGEAVRWTPIEGGYTIEFLGALPGHTQSIATAINDQGDIVGYSIVPGFQGGPSVWFNGPQGVVDLGALGMNGLAYDINEQRVVVGGRARVDLDTLTAELLPVPSIPGFSSFSSLVVSRGVNDSGQVVGHGVLNTSQPDRQVPIRYTDGVGWEALVALASPFGTAYDINNDAETALVAIGSPGYVQAPGAGLASLTARVDPAQPGWTVRGDAGMDVNNAGQILATGVNSITGHSGVILLTPMGGALLGDIDGDGRVNFNDLNLLLGEYGQSGPGLGGDLDGDGAVGFADLNLLLGQFNAGA